MMKLNGQSWSGEFCVLYEIENINKQINKLSNSIDCVAPGAYL